MLLNTLLGCVVFLATNLSLLYASHLLARRFFPHVPDAARLVGIGVLYYAFIIVLLQVLSPFQAITQFWVTVVCLLTALVCHFLWGVHRSFNADIGPVKKWINDGLSSRWAALIIICGFVVLLSLLRALLMPPLAWDSLTYHLTLAALWIKKGTLFFLQAPHQMQNVYFPINGELFATWILLPFHNDLLVNTMNFPITFLGGVACYAIARELGLNREEASFVPALICFASVIYAEITTQYVDNAAFAFCVSSVLFTLRYLFKGHHYDGFLALASAGILLGTKYSVIPVAGMVIIIVAIKTVTLAGYPGFLRKTGLILSGIFIFCALGGRQYIINTVDARNPLYPFPVIIFNQVLDGRSANAEEVKWQFAMNTRTDKTDNDKSSLWIQEYKKFCYLPLSAGPKFVPLLFLALISLFISPPLVPKKCWYSLFLMWLIPIIISYTSSTADIVNGETGQTVNTRYFSPYIALFAIQGIVVLQIVLKQLRSFKLVFAAFVGWDLFFICRNYPWEIQLLFPYAALFVFIMIIACKTIPKKAKILCRQGISAFSIIGTTDRTRPHFQLFIAYAVSFILIVSVVYLFQTYRYETGYYYYRTQTDYHDFPREFVDGWEFMDKPGEKKTIALAAGWEPPGTKWFFYPLMGRRLQNDVTYASAKYKWDVPTWLHRGMLEGKDFDIWLHNLKRKKVDYVFAQKPFSIETGWMRDHRDKFQLVFWDQHCAIFKYTDEGASIPESK